MFQNEDTNNEIKRRTEGKIPYDTETLDFTTKLNDALLKLEEELLHKNLSEEYPNIFIIGQSRSGTTLLSQVLFNNLDLSCTDNLFAKFWKTPLCGAYLSKLALENRKSPSYESVYGRTGDVYSPNGFGWFWRNVLNIKSNDPNNPTSSSAGIDWKHLRSVIVNINHILGKGVIYKPAESLAILLKKFDALFSKAIYIYIERDLLDLAISLANARIDYYSSVEALWWSALSPIPEEFKKLENEPYEIQIAGQIFYINRMFEKSTEEIPQEKLIRIKYADLCSNPQLLLNKVKERIAGNSGFIINQVNTPPVLTASHPQISTDIRKKLSAGLNQFYGNTITD